MPIPKPNPLDSRKFVTARAMKGAAIRDGNLSKVAELDRQMAVAKVEAAVAAVAPIMTDAERAGIATLALTRQAAIASLVENAPALTSEQSAAVVSMIGGASHA